MPIIPSQHPLDPLFVFALAGHHFSSQLIVRRSLLLTTSGSRISKLVNPSRGSMSFSFNFASSEDVLMDEADDFAAQDSGEASSSSVPQLQICPQHPDGNPPSSSTSKVQSRRLDLEEMLNELPDRISYSWVQVPLPSSSSPSQAASASSSSSSLWLPRRDLFDARFQILHDNDNDDEHDEGQTKVQDDDEAAAESAAVVGTESDLIPGLYEGGLKTWESSVDLVGVLDGMRREGGGGRGGGWWSRGGVGKEKGKERRVVEVSCSCVYASIKDEGLTADAPLPLLQLGCGTALPTMYILRDLMLLQSSGSTTTTTHLHLCDFNQRVLRLVTLPNLLLAYHFARQDAQQQRQNTSAQPENGELDLDEDFLAQFRRDMEERKVQLSFHAGPWEGLQLVDQAEGRQPPRADLVLTSETTYRSDVVQSLVQTMRRLLVDDEEDGKGEDGVALVATKDYYFGLGGGIVALQSALDEDDKARNGARRAHVETKRQSTAGVKRSVLAVSWPSRS